MKRSTITGIVVLGLLGLTAKEIMDFNHQASILEFKVFTDKSDWRRCPSGLYNAAGDSVSTCVVGDDTIVDISL